MGKKLSYIVFVALTLLIVNKDLLAEDVGILCDVSKSLRNRWLMEGKKAIKELVLYGKVSDGWELSSAKKDFRYQFIIQHKSPIETGNTIMLLEFGSVVEQSFPYFRNPQLYQVVNRTQLEQFIDNNFPIHVKDDWTYELLAEAVAAKIFKETIKSSECYLIVLSDFIEDHGFSLSKEQIDLVDRFETEVEVSFSIPVILRWKKNTNLQIKVLKVSAYGKDEITKPGRLLQLLAPQSAMKFKSDKGITFSWRWNGSKEDINDYNLVIRKKEPRQYKMVHSKKLLRTRYSFRRPLEVGKFQWYVTANTQKGLARSSTRGFEIKGKSIIPWLILILFLFCGLIAFMKYGWPKIQALRRRKYEY